MLADTLKKGGIGIKYSYYREHTHAIASGVDSGAVMAELFAKDTGTCRGTGGSMHIYDKDTNFQGGWALVSEHPLQPSAHARQPLLKKSGDACAFAQLFFRPLPPRRARTNVGKFDTRTALNGPHQTSVHLSST